MKAACLADSTVARRVKTARQIFHLAKRWKFVVENPFADVKASSMSNRTRQFYIDRKAVAEVLNACPDAEWRLIFALSRFGGLRCPSETMALTWGDVDWSRGRLRVPSSETEHIPGRECRFIPLFPEVRTPLQEVFARAAEGSTFIITKYRGATTNLRSQLKDSSTGGGADVAKTFTISEAAVKRNLKRRFRHM